jgi:hypothetical protein
MKKYSVAIPWHATVFIKVKAKNKKEAEVKALENSGASICYQCSRSGLEIGEYNEDCDIDVQEIK